MKKILFAFVLVIPFAFNTFAESKTETPSDTLVVLWTSGDPDVAEKVALMYTHAAGKNNWFDQVILIVWGPSANVLAHNKSLQTKVKTMVDDSISVQACVVCADSYGVSDDLRELGIEVIGMGRPLTDYLKKGYKQLTF